MTKADIEALVGLGREGLMARGLTADEADALLDLPPLERRRVLLEAMWDAAPDEPPAAKRETDVVGGRGRMQRKYPYLSFQWMGQPPAKDCDHVPMRVGKLCPRTVMVPVVRSRQHERELCAKHGLEKC